MILKKWLRMFMTPSQKYIMVNLPDQILQTLRPWQRLPAQHLVELLQRGQNVVDFSETGTGKSATACGVIKALDPITTLIVCPKVIVSAWKGMLERFETSASVIGYERLRTGGTFFGKWQNRIPAKALLKCEHCQCFIDEKSPRCYAHPSGIHSVEMKKGPKKRGQFVFAPQIEFVIFDELQRCSGMNSDNAELMVAAKRQGKKIMGLSATAACTPLQMRALGYSLDIFSNPDAAFYSWSRRHGCGKLSGIPGWHWLAGAERRREIMANINAEILPERGVRVRTSEIPGFPERLITAELYDLEKNYEIEKLYREMASALDALILREAQDVNPESALTQILRARQRISLLRVPILVELAEDELAKGNSVAIFVNFTATLDELSKRLRTTCIVSGSQNGIRERNEHIASFQMNESRIILLNSAAGGVAIGLQDLTGEHPRVALVEPTYSAVQMIQIFGRLPRDGGKSLSRYRIILAANTIETRIQKAFQAKQHCIEALNDSDLDPLTTTLQ